MSVALYTKIRGMSESSSGLGVRSLGIGRYESTLHGVGRAGSYLVPLMFSRYLILFNWHI